MAPRVENDRSSETYDIQALLQGDQTAFEEMVRELGPRLYRVIKRIVKDEDEAGSVLQETFLQVYKGLARFRGESRFSTWVYAIGINLSRAALRKRQRFELMEEADIDRLLPVFEKGMFATSTAQIGTEIHVEIAERKRLVHEAIDRLPVQYRLIITLRDIEEYDTREVAQILGITEGNVRVRLHRGRQALRKMLLPYVVSYK